MNITATIIAYNEAHQIEACIRSAQRICDEVIVVVDTKTTDDTAAIAESLGCVVKHQEYLGDGPQKAFGVQFARNDWIFSIDADELLDEDAVAAIQALDLGDSRVDAYAVRRRNYVGQHWIKAAGFYPDHVIRLYHKQRAAYVPKKGHAYVDAKNIQQLNAHLTHFTYKDYAHWMDRLNALSSRDAWAMYDRGKRATTFSALLHALVAFVRKFILKGGMFQGLDGLTVTATTVFRTYMKYLKLIEMTEAKGAAKKAGKN